jgi:tRNA (cmo5U34)-methyltransferase
MEMPGTILDEQRSSLGHMPDGRWQFDAPVTEVFSDMLRRSIPQYEVMRRAVFEIGKYFARPGTHIVDLGCSRGDALAPFVEAFRERNRYVGVEVSAPMLASARERFKEASAAGLVEILDLDLRDAYPNAAASVTLCVLTLQFTPIEHRQRILCDAYRNTVEGGVLIVVEKVLGSSIELCTMMSTLYHQFKAESGYSREEIERKRLALEGVLVPITDRWNQELLRGAGFAQVDCFWRWLNFAAYIARRD